jgi:hypothetical protein
MTGILLSGIGIASAIAFGIAKLVSWHESTGTP